MSIKGKTMSKINNNTPNFGMSLFMPKHTKMLKVIGKPATQKLQQCKPEISALANDCDIHVDVSRNLFDKNMNYIIVHIQKKADTVMQKFINYLERKTLITNRDILVYFPKRERFNENLIVNDIETLKSTTKKLF